MQTAHIITPNISTYGSPAPDSKRLFSESCRLVKKTNGPP